MDQACDQIKRVLGEDPKAGAKLDSLKLPSSDISITRYATKQSRDEQSVDSDANIHLTPIQLLPDELFLTIFKLCVSEDTPVRDITPLTLVCKIWRNIVEGAPGLWGQISGKEALPSVLKALAMAKDAPLEITYWEHVAETDPATFFGEIGSRTAQWRSLDITTGKSYISIAALEEAAVPNLRSLRFRVPRGQEWEGGAEVTLFRGEPAPPTLKDFCVESIPVIVEPLHLSGLRSLDLKEMPIISAEEVLRVLRHSPALECCHLDSLVGLEDFGFSESDQELLRLEGVQTPTTQLSRLQFLSIRGPPMSFVHLLLSVIQAPSLISLLIDIQIDREDQSPKLELFTSRISHLSPTLTTLLSTAQHIEIITYSCAIFRIYVETLTIELNGPAVEYIQMDETLEWIFSHIGRHRKALPASLAFFGLDIETEWLTWLASALKVTRLVFRTHPPNYLHIVSLLSQPLVPASDQWLLPDLERIVANVVNEGGKSDILEMVKARSSFIEAQGKQERGEIVLQPFKGIRLRGGRNGVRKDHSFHTDFLIELQKAARGAEIWWENFKWTGSEESNSAMSLNGAEN